MPNSSGPRWRIMPSMRRRVFSDGVSDRSISTTPAMPHISQSGRVYVGAKAHSILRQEEDFIERGQSGERLDSEKAQMLSLPFGCLRCWGDCYLHRPWD